MSTMKEKYEQDVVPVLMKELALDNSMQLPRLAKIVVNMGIGIVDKAVFATHVTEMEQVTGQKPVVTKASKSISNFKLREGMPLGSKVTLRGKRMYEFLDRLINAALPRIRDFRGVPPSGFDQQGNYTIGIKEQTIFPEIDPNKSSNPQGMDITIVTERAERDSAFKLLEGLGMPFAKHN